jgi:hypothetical protein
MKKIISIILCVVLSALVLVGCGEDPIGEYLPNYEKPVEKEKLSINLYIVADICENEECKNSDYANCEHRSSDKNALVTVQQKIADYTTAKFKTTVNVKFYSFSEYNSIIMEKAKSTGLDKADIILVTSESMMDSLLAADVPADLTEFFEGKKYGTLNARISAALLEKTLISVEDQMRNYCVPNNRVVGEYEYVLINRETAKKYSIDSKEKLNQYNTDDALAELETLFGADYQDAVTIEYGNYGIEYDSAKYHCNIISYPSVTRSYAFESAFVINKNTSDIERAMEIVYALNTDVELHNYLTYGLIGTNYSFDQETETVTLNNDLSSNSNYFMNPLYTGDIFTSYFCEEYNWNLKAKNNGEIQNHEAIKAED